MGSINHPFDESNERTRLLPSVPLARTRSEADESSTSLHGRCSRCPSFQVNWRDEFLKPIVEYGKQTFTVENAKNKFPIVKWLPKYSFDDFTGDMVAGLTVGLTAIPQGLAYAVVAGLPPQYGLYAAFMGAFVYCFFGTSKDITLGPTAILSLMTGQFGSSRSPVKGDPTYVILITFICGFIQLTMGLLNLGLVVQFISLPVISGFTSAAAVIIAFGQVKELFGLKDVSSDFLPQVKQTFDKLGETNLWDMTMGIICVVVLFVMKKLNDVVSRRMKLETKRSTRVLYKIIWLLCTGRNAVVVLICAGIAASLVEVYNINKLTLTATISVGIPPPAIPSFTLNVTDGNQTIFRSTAQMFSDIGEGFIVIALISILESIAIAKAFARTNRYSIDPNQEILTIGLCNIVSSFFHSYPVTGSFSRTAINSQSGVRTPAGGIWTGALVILALLVLTPYFKYIPQTALAAVIICAVLPMIDFEIVPQLWHVKKLDLLPLFITVIVCIVGSIEYGILAGIGFSLLLILYPSARPTLNITYKKLRYHNKAAGTLDDHIPTEAVIIDADLGLKFPSIDYIKDTAIKLGALASPQRHVILNAWHFVGCDFSAVQGIKEICEYFSNLNIQFIMACCPDSVRDVLIKAQIKSFKYTESIETALELLSSPSSDCHDEKLPLGGTASPGDSTPC